MSKDYNLSALNDKEFEILCADLISAEESIKVERFKPGRDGGIDGRFYINTHDQCIIQCKHWEKSGYNALLRQIKSKERSKIDILKPKQYKLMTSVPLSAQNKDELISILSPWVTFNTASVSSLAKCTLQLLINSLIELKRMRNSKGVNAKYKDPIVE